MFPEPLRVTEIVCALSQALDLASGSTPWHSVRTCILGMRIAAELKLPETLQRNLYYVLLLKDAGSPGEFRRVRCAGRNTGSWQQGLLAGLIRLPEETVTNLSGHHERWDGKGNGEDRRGAAIPIISRITLVAQTLDTISTTTGLHAALGILDRKQGTWFDPHVAQAAKSLALRAKLWIDLHDSQLLSQARAMEPLPRTVSGEGRVLEMICRAFAAIVDAKSPFTYNHSHGVANAAVAMARKMGLADSRVTLIRRAALLHDLGKMAIPNSILQKSGTLDSGEWQEMRAHPEHTWRILHPIRGFEEISEVAASHHERLDGTGYFRGFSSQQLSLECRILAIADIFEALSATRPYRHALPIKKVFEIIRQSSPQAFDPTCLEALEQTTPDDGRSHHNAYDLQRSPEGVRLASDSFNDESLPAIAVPAGSLG